MTNIEDIKSITVTWEDDLVSDSYKLVLPEYNLDCVHSASSESGIAITVVGNVEDVDRFAEDYEDDAFEVLDNLSLKYQDDDDEYITALNNLMKVNATA